MGQVLSMMKEMGYLKMFGMNVNDLFNDFFREIVNPAAVEAGKQLGIQMTRLRAVDHMHEVTHMILDPSFDLGEATSKETSWTEMQIDEMISIALIERTFAGKNVFDHFEANDSIIVVCSSHPIRGWSALFSQLKTTDKLIEYISNDHIRVRAKKQIQKNIVFALKQLFPTDVSLKANNDCKAIACIMNTIVKMCAHEKQVMTEEQEILYRRFNLQLKCEIRRSLKKECNKEYRRFFNVGELFASTVKTVVDLPLAA